MPTLLCISRHSPENCPLFNEKTKKLTLNIADKIEGLANKHGIKVIGVWNVPSEHLIVMLYDAPSLEAYEKFTMDPVMLPWDSFNTTYSKVAYGMEQAIKMLKEVK